ncbi:corrinoid protein [Crateriforma conspicua]|uniref:Methionine synthase n=1 Tax=Crateriforma conspicua TaxID=2527996 RepID=A0A5C5Y9Z7_9PLAN|nr:corrinoid protein [Crateriforma conspicua]QDV62083.1 Methionine synthase [Crateriforma conspicua]TWT71748.1 Methionine synthase [Crateriforma conspicua]
MSESGANGSPLYEAILTGDADGSVKLTQTALADGVDPNDLINQDMIPAMDEAGRRFEKREFYVPELLIAARAMKGALALIRPLLSERGVEPVGRVVIGTVKGDLHDIGKGLVGSMLEGGGFEVFDLGVDVAADSFIAKAVEQKADVVAVSALLTTTMTAMKDVVTALRESDISQTCKIIVGGAPVTQQFADSIGADGYSENASAAVTLVRSIVTPA